MKHASFSRAMEPCQRCWLVDQVAMQSFADLESIALAHDLGVAVQHVAATAHEFQQSLVAGDELALITVRDEVRQAEDTIGLEAELRALRMHAGLPWWRRLLTTTAPPADAVAIPVGAK